MSWIYFAVAYSALVGALVYIPLKLRELHSRRRDD